MKKDQFKSPDHYDLDLLLTDEQLMVRSSVRDWVKGNVSPIIEDAVLMENFPKEFIKGLANIGAFGSFLPAKYGGSGLDLYHMD